MKGEKGLYGMYKCGYFIIDNYGDLLFVVLFYGLILLISVFFFLFLVCGCLSFVVGYFKIKV